MQGVFKGALRQHQQGLTRAQCRVVRLLQGVLERAGTGDGLEDFIKMAGVAMFNAAAYQLTLLGCAMLHQVNQRQRWFAFAQIVANVLANVSRHTRIIKRVIDQLKSRSQRAAIFCGGFNLNFARAGKQCPELGRCFKQLGGLGANDL